MTFPLVVIVSPKRKGVILIPPKSPELQGSRGPDDSGTGEDCFSDDQVGRLGSWPTKGRTFFQRAKIGEFVAGK